MKPSYLFVCIFAMLALTSAAKTSKKSEVRIEKSWKKNAKPLAFEEIDTKDLLEFAESCDVFGNILVVENYNNSGKYLLEFVDMNTMNIKKQALLRGNGPGEVTFAIIYNSGKYLIVDASQNDKFARIDVAEYMKSQDSRIHFRNYGFFSQAMGIWDDEHFITVNPYKFYSKAMNIDQNDEPRFLIIKDSDDIPEKKGLFEALDPSAGKLMINHQKKRICFALNAFSIVEFYDFDLNPLKTLTGPDDMDAKFQKIGNYIRYDQSGIPHAYSNYCYDDSNIYLAYEGQMLNPMEILMNDGKIENVDTYIFKLDWDGNIKGSFIVHKDKKIKSMSIGPKGELYLACEVEGILKLFKARM